MYVYILQLTCMVIDDDGVDEADLSKWRYCSWALHSLSPSVETTDTNTLLVLILVHQYSSLEYYQLTTVVLVLLFVFFTVIVIVLVCFGNRYNFVYMQYVFK